MNEREQEIQHDVRVFHSLASLEVTILDATMVQMGLNAGLIDEKNQAMILQALYGSVADTAVRLGSWEEALLLVRTDCVQGSGNADTQVAYERLLRETNHLFNL